MIDLCSGFVAQHDDPREILREALAMEQEITNRAEDLLAKITR